MIAQPVLAVSGVVSFPATSEESAAGCRAIRPQNDTCGKNPDNNATTSDMPFVREGECHAAVNMPEIVLEAMLEYSASVVSPDRKVSFERYMHEKNR